MSLLVLRHGNYKRVVSSPNLVSSKSTTGRPKSHELSMAVVGYTINHSGLTRQYGTVVVGMVGQ